MYICKCFLSRKSREGGRKGMRFHREVKIPRMLSEAPNEAAEEESPPRRQSKPEQAGGSSGGGAEAVL